MEKSKVYFTKNITPESLIKMYEVLNKPLEGKVAVKISTGEMGGHNYLKPELIKDLVHHVNGTIVECNTAYAGKRNTTKEHEETIKAHGFYDIAPVDIMDRDGSMELKVNGGRNITTNLVGKHLANYDSMIMLSHFKGHAMGGFGGALKNMSIGVASSAGKANIHTAGKTKEPNELFQNLPAQDNFLEAMAEASMAVMEYMSNNIVYINVMNNLSVDCDCDSNPEEPCMADIGILSSLDPVALDEACLDLIYNSNDSGKEHMCARIERQNGRYITVYAADELHIGSREYELINID